MDAYSNQPHFRVLIDKIKTSNDRVATFGELSKSIFSGITPKAKGDAYVEPPQGVRFIRSGEITEDGGILPESEIHISESVHNGLMRRSQIHKGDLLIAIVGATIGASGIYEYSAPANINQAIAAVRFSDSSVLLDYARWYLHSSLGQAILDYLKRPVARANINLEEIGEIPLIIPSLERQHALVAEMEAARTKHNRKFEEADALLSGMNASLLNSLGIALKKTVFPRFYAAKLKDAWGRCDPDYHSPKFKQLRAAIEGSGYPVYDVGTLAPNPRTGFAAGRQDQAFDEVEGIPHVRPLNITKHGELTFEGTKFVPRATAGPDDILLNGEVLLNNTNSTEWVGKTTVFEGQCECCCSNHITRLNPVSSLVTPWFLASLLNAMRSTGYLGLLATNFVNQAGINTETLSSLRLPVPPLKKQEAIISELSDRRTIARRLRDEAAKEWDAAKARFGAKLLGTEAGNESR